MEWFGKEKPSDLFERLSEHGKWTHRHDDGKMWVHPVNTPCFNPGYTGDPPKAPCIWGVLGVEYEIDSNTWHWLFKTYDDEKLARHRAEMNPDMIFFFAESISHPNS